HWTRNCKRLAPTARGLPRSLMPRPRAAARWKAPIVKSPSGSTPPSTRLDPCSPRTSAEGAMPQVSVTINGRQFRMACEDGEEEHLTHLAQELDARIVQLRARFGEIGDTRLTVMAALALPHQPSR